jgi:hypothetical protein
MVDLAEFLVRCFAAGVKGPLSVINTDNMPGNGAKIRAHVTDPEVLQAIRGPGDHAGEAGRGDSGVYVMCYVSLCGAARESSLGGGAAD